MGEFGFRWLLIDIMSLKLFIGLSRSQGQLINALMAPITDAPTINFVTQCSILAVGHCNGAM